MEKTTCMLAESGMDRLVANCRFAERFMELCRACNNYGTNWACPPYDFDAGAFFKEFRHVYLFGVKIEHGEKIRAETNTREKASAYAGKMFKDVNGRLAEVIYELEAAFPGSVGLSAGGCDFCDICSRGEEAPCRYPERPRRSLESIGFDVSKISGELMGVPLLWMDGALPPYLALVNGLCVKEPDSAVPGRIRAALAKRFPRSACETPNL